LVLTFLVLSFWYLLTRVDPDIFQTSSKTVVCVCVCVSWSLSGGIAICYLLRFCGWCCLLVMADLGKAERIYSQSDLPGGTDLSPQCMFRPTHRGQHWTGTESDIYSCLVSYSFYLGDTNAAFLYTPKLIETR